MKKIHLSVIIPVYNEMPTIGAILRVVCTWKKRPEIIVVDDGSTDKTSQKALQFMGRVHLIRNSKNLGKSQAMIQGIRRARGAWIMFLDGDLFGLTHENLDTLIEPIMAGRADMVVGTRRASLFAAHFLRPFGGERVFRRLDLVKLIPKMERVGYGVEVVFNSAYYDRRVCYVALPNVYHAIKLKKYTVPEAIFFYLKEGIEVLPRYFLFLLRLMMVKAKQMIRLAAQ